MFSKDSFSLKGDLIFTKSPECFECHPDSYLVVIDNIIEGIWKELPDQYKNLESYDMSGKLVIPGLSDLHVHASQYQYRGLWMDEELLTWLNEHTFPEEAKYKNKDYAEKAYRIFAEDLAKSPTTHACIFATIHKDSTLLLASLLEEKHLPCYVGKVNMDRNSPDILCERSDESIKATIEYVEETLNKFTLVKPIITPRFIPSVTDSLAAELGKLAVRYNIPVQSHLSENRSEIDWVMGLSPESKSYADAYRRLGLWGEVKTIMAHCVYSHLYEPEDLKNDNVYAAHCPDSNTNLSSGIMPARLLLEEGCNLGLGSDIAGGTSLSIFRAITDSIKASKLYWALENNSLKALSFCEAFDIASRQGGSFFGKMGTFVKGYEADFVVLDDSCLLTTIEGLTLAERLERYTYLAPDRPVAGKYAGGGWADIA